MTKLSDFVPIPLDVEAPRPDPALWTEGGAWNRRDYCDQIDYRIRLRQRAALSDLGISSRSEFDLACRLSDDPGFRQRIAQIRRRSDLEQIRRALDAIDDEENAELKQLRQRCERCGGDRAAPDSRFTGVLCPQCIATSLALPSTPPTNGIRSALARARMAGLPATLTKAQWREAVKHFNDRCAMCDGPWCLVEHATPVDLGGGTTAANCLPACTPCNVRKGGATIEELSHARYMTLARWNRERLDTALAWLRQRGRV